MEKTLPNGDVKIIPDEGNTIICLTDGREYSEVVCSQEKKKNYMEVTK